MAGTIRDSVAYLAARLTAGTAWAGLLAAAPAVAGSPALAGWAARWRPK